MELKNIKTVSLFGFLNYTFGRNSTPPALQFLCRILHHLANYLRVSHKVRVPVRSKKKTKGLMKIVLLFPRMHFSFVKENYNSHPFLCNWLLPTVWNTDSCPMHFGLGPMERDQKLDIPHPSRNLQWLLCLFLPVLLFSFPLLWELYVSGRCLIFSLDFWMRALWSRNPQLATWNMCEKSFLFLNAIKIYGLLIILTQMTNTKCCAF